MKSKYRAYIMVFGELTRDVDVMSLFIFGQVGQGAVEYTNCISAVS